MKIRALHDWDVSYDKAVRIQEGLRKRLVLSGDIHPFNITTIAGADISYSPGDDVFYASVVLIEYPALKVIETVCHSERVTFPYIPGLLTFREGPPLLAAFERLAGVPDVVIFDGHGTAHPRRIGLASHMGLFLDVPTIGCAKKRLIGVYEEPGTGRGESSLLTLENETIGAVVRTREKVKPVFVSQGHKIDLDSAVGIVLSCCRRYRLPEPTRTAHLEVNRFRRECSSPLSSR
ncbi:MAG: deoxyribonuclease V [Deltaproteobacteria bacterium]|nr:deoxyribonuclease V [Deltaproteobacteria bacterium]